MTSSLKAKFQNANRLLELGQADAAEKEYRQIKLQDPKHFLATYNLAIIAMRRGHLEDAERLLADALTLQPNFTQGFYAHAKVLSDMGRADDAVASYDRFLATQPGNADALSDRAVALLKHDRFDAALIDVDKALAINPRHLAALYNRATVMDGLKRHTEALADIDKAIAVKPDFVEALLYRGNILQRLKRHEAAAESYRAALVYAPKRADLHSNLSAALLDWGKWEEALKHADTALSLHPPDYAAYINRGRSLGKLGRDDEELQTYNAALSVRPNFTEALVSRGVFFYNARRYAEALADLERALALMPSHQKAALARGNVLMIMGRKEDALAVYDGVLRINPKNAEALNNRGIALRVLSRFEEAAQTFQRLSELEPDRPYIWGELFGTRLMCCDWTDYDKISASLLDKIRLGQRAQNPFLFLAHSTDEQDQLKCARVYAEHKYPAASQSRWVIPPYDNAKLKIAYVSADFHDHATAHLMAGLFESHDRSKFECTAISFGASDSSEMRNRLQSSFDSFVDASTMSDESVVDLLRGQHIDIAVDLKGFTNEARPNIFAKRAAPIQVNYLGYPCTWGSSCMDYMIADAHVIPPGHDVYYAEKIIRLPDSYQPNDRKRKIADHTPTRADVGLPDTGFVFCCFNSNYKIAPHVFDIWMRLLLAVNDSVLWLFESSPAVTRHLRREAEQRGIRGDRLIFAPLLAPEHHLARHRLADLFLDTAPCGAHTTASDALWAGLPLITCAGTTFAGRVATSLLHAHGLPELVAKDWLEYESLALKLAMTPRSLADAKAKVMRHRETHPLFDTERLRRHLETAFTIMAERYKAGLSPESFDVAALSSL